MTDLILPPFSQFIINNDLLDGITSDTLINLSLMSGVISNPHSLHSIIGKDTDSILTESSIIILYCVNCKFSILSAPPCGNHMLLPQCTVHCNTVY